MSVGINRSAFSEALELVENLISNIKKKLLIQPIGMHGELDVVHIREGKEIGRWHYNNIIVNTGKAEVAGLINGVTSGAFTYMAIGITGTGEVNTDTALASEISSGGGSRASATCNRVTTTYTDDTAQWVKTWTFSSGFAVVESGIFDAASTGVMLSRKTFSAVNVVSGDQLQITWKVQVSAS